MKKGKTLRFIVMFLSGFLATTSSVYANHFAAAGVKSHITSDTKVQFWFLGVSSPKLGFEPVIPTQFQCTVVHQDESLSFWMFASAKENASFSVVPIGKESPDGHTITITGKLLSHIIIVSKRGVRFFTDTADFIATGIDVTTPGEGQDDVATPKDRFHLEFLYREKGSGCRLLETLGSGLVDPDDDKDICKLQLEGDVEFGEIKAHTASGD